MRDLLAGKILGYRHPCEHIRYHAEKLYDKGVESMHLGIEIQAGMISRLSEDRIESGNVVS